MVFEFFANADKIKPPRRYQHRDEIYSLSARQTLSREFYRNTSGDVTVRPKNSVSSSEQPYKPGTFVPVGCYFCILFLQKGR